MKFNSESLQLFANKLKRIVLNYSFFIVLKTFNALPVKITNQKLERYFI